MTIKIKKEKQLKYSVVNDTGSELMKFYSFKVARAYAIEEEAIILSRKHRI